MAVFVYSGRTRGGQTLTGEMEAANREAVVAKLRTQQIIATSVRAKAREIVIPGFGGGVTEKDIVVFTRQFATMIDAGLPLVQCLEILASQQENKVFKKTLMDIRQSVEGGSTFADALAKHPKVFDNLYVNLVAAGEVGGILDTILARLAAYIEKALKLSKQIKGAMVYPSTILAVALIVTTVLLLYVIPIFGKMFMESGQALPGPTQFVMDLSGYARKYFLVVVIAIALVVVAIRMYYKTEKGRRNIDRLLLKVPVLGSLIQDSAMRDRVNQVINDVAAITDQVRKGEGTVGKLIMDEQLHKDAQDVVARIRNLVADAEQGKGTLGVLLKDEQTARRLADGVSHFEEIVGKINTGEGTLGQVVNNREAWDRIVFVLRQVQEAVEDFREQAPINTFVNAIFTAF